MPNWTTNCIVCHNDDLDNLLVEDNVDFSKWMPMPDALHQTEGGAKESSISFAQGILPIHEAIELIVSPFRDYSPERSELSKGDGTRVVCDPESFLMRTYHLDGTNYVISSLDELRLLGQIYLDNKEKYGSDTWYYWAISNWGVKWNASSTSVVPVGSKYSCITFSTPWSNPSPQLIEMMLAGLSHPAIYEVTYEGEDEIYDAVHDYVLDPEESICFGVLYFNDDDEEITEEEAQRLEEEGEYIYSSVESKELLESQVASIIGN